MGERRIQRTGFRLVNTAQLAFSPPTARVQVVGEPRLWQFRMIGRYAVLIDGKTVWAVNDRRLQKMEAYLHILWPADLEHRMLVDHMLS